MSAHIAPDLWEESPSLMTQARRVLGRLFGDPGITYMLSGAFTLAAISFFSDRTVAARTVVGEAVHPYDACWNALYLLAGVLVLASYIMRLRQIDHDGYTIEHRLGTDIRWEAAGLIALAGGLMLNGATSLAVQGLGDIRSYVFTVFIAGCAARFRRLCCR